eukprot:gb/GECG01006982.1/.p1 GENE.gb/GECG01006982.1/~~gb/GECG01006982.1/.p1  ORF type:complete len:157 (+),score=14.53 gb/GECG01006982.1/:1-471(+)
MSSWNGSMLEKTCMVHASVAIMAGLGNGGYGSPFNVGIAIFGILVAYLSKPQLAVRFLILLSFALLADIAWLGLWTHDIESQKTYDQSSVEKQKHTGQFAIGMAIVCLMLKPVMGFFGYRVYAEGGGVGQDYVDMQPDGEHPAAQGAAPYVGSAGY